MLRNTLNTFITAAFIMLLGVSSSAHGQFIDPNYAPPSMGEVPAGVLMGTTSVTWGDKTASEIQHSIQSILVPAAPILLGPADLPSISGPSLVGDDALQYTITSNANGEDKYALTLEIVSAGVEDAGVPVVVGVEGGMVTLGATAAMEAANAGADAIKVPSDGVIDNAVNGITNGDTVIINDNPYTVGVVDDDGNTATIPLTTPLIGPVAFGDRIAERETFAVSLDDVGTIIDGAETGTVTITVTATSTSLEAPAADDDVVVNLLTPVGPSVEKYVRNVTPDNDSNPPDNLEWVEQGFAYKYPPEDGTFYFRSQLNDGTREDEALVKAKKDDILEYLIVLKAGNQEDQTGITLNETISPFTEYFPRSAQINNAPMIGVIWSALKGKSSVIIENWPVTDHDGESLTIAANTSAHLTYQVTVMGGVGGGDGDSGEVGDSNNDMAAEFCQSGGAFVGEQWKKCENEPWNAAKGINSTTNPVCWSNNVGWGGDAGQNPWVVGVPNEMKDERYNCTTKCAQGEQFGWCNQNGWLDKWVEAGGDRGVMAPCSDPRGADEWFKVRCRM